MDTHEMKYMSKTREDPVQAEAAAHSRDYGAVKSVTSVRRIFSFTQLYFFALAYMASWEAMFTNIGLCFWNGGPRAMIWGFFIIVPGVLCQVASFSELSSSLPIAGAQYHFTWHLAPPRYRRFLTWVQGWITWFSWIALLAGIVNIEANMIGTFASASYPSYVAKSWHTVLIMYAVLAVLGLLNMYLFWIIPWIELVAGLLHIILWVIYAAVLLTLSPRHSTNFVFLEKSNLSGWENDFVSFNLGIILITWGFVGFDAVIHLSEETRKAKSTAPRAMFWSICLNSCLAFGMVIIMLYTLGDVEEVANSLYAPATIFLVAAQTVRGSSALCAGLLCTNTAGCIGTIASTSRLTWAWARDGALPSYFAYVDPEHRIPLRSVWLPLAMVMLLSLLNLINYTAFSVIISLSTLGLFQSYIIATACMLHARLTGRLETAPWSLGRYGVAINIGALVFSVWLSVFLVFPVYLPVTATTMNWALPINALVWIFATVFWFWRQRTWKGLDVVVIDKVIEDGDRDTKE